MEKTAARTSKLCRREKGGAYTEMSKREEGRRVHRDLCKWKERRRVHCRREKGGTQNGGEWDEAVKSCMEAAIFPLSAPL
ncbi:hypothetical protein J27TS7_15200 [Paenibacillus dendritiformis]|nr:hypothetical protein J27TS7_15200 [Paenibacillus dendritiformis]